MSDLIKELRSICITGEATASAICKKYKDFIGKPVSEEEILSALQSKEFKKNDMGLYRLSNYDNLGKTKENIDLSQPRGRKLGKHIFNLPNKNSVMGQNQNRFVVGNNDRSHSSNQRYSGPPRQAVSNGNPFNNAKYYNSPPPGLAANLPSPINKPLGMDTLPTNGYTQSFKSLEESVETIIDRLGHIFPKGMDSNEIADYFRSELRDIEEALIRHPRIFYEETYEFNFIFYFKPTIPNEEHIKVCHAIQRMAELILKEAGRPLHIEDLSNRMNVISPIFENPVSAVYDAISKARSCSIGIEGHVPDVHLYYNDSSNLKAPYRNMLSSTEGKKQKVSRCLELIDQMEDEVNAKDCMNLTEKDIISFSQYIDNWAEVIVVDFKSLCNFSIRLRDNERNFELMNRCLQIDCNRNQPPLLLRHAITGQFIAFRENGEDYWQRAKVLIGGRSNILIHLLDFGVSRFIEEGDSIISLPADYILKGFAFPCNIEINDVPDETLDYTENLVHNILSQGGSAKILRINSTSSSHGVELKMMYEKGTISLPSHFHDLSKQLKHHTN